jgi:hypothetical protein
MAKFRIHASYRVNLVLDIEADTVEDAWVVALCADGGDFTRLPDSDSDWEINDVVDFKFLNIGEIKK